jgi:hypothetical protein
MEPRPLNVVAQAVRDGDLASIRLQLHPYLHWTDHTGMTIRGRNHVLAMLGGRAGAIVDEPVSLELRDGQIYRWVEPLSER